MLTAFAADEDQKLLLYVDCVCGEVGISLPWDTIAARMEPRDASKGEKPMTGEAIKQHLAKLRDHRDNKGLDVPPKLDRNARRSIAGKNMPQTPAPTPRKSSGFGGGMAVPKSVSGRGRAQAIKNETPVKKESSLLAPVSKSKQKKAEKAMKAALKADNASVTPAATSRGGKDVGGAKITTGKRGRRPAAAAVAMALEDEYHDGTVNIGAVPGRQPRHAQPKSYEAMAPDLAEIGIKDEPESEDDLPLSKKRNTGQKGGGRKKPAVGLMGDTVQMWQNRNAISAVGESAAESPVEQSIEQVTSVPGHGNDQPGHPGPSQAGLGGLPNDTGLLSNGSNYHGNTQRSEATVGSMSNELGLPFGPVNFQGPGAYDRLDQQLHEGRFRAYLPQIESGHPSPMDVSFNESQVFGRPAHIQVPSSSYSHMGQFGDNNPFVSSPAYDQSMSSATIPGSDFNPSFGSDFSHMASRTTSGDSNFSNTQGLHDPFNGTSGNGGFAGLPLDTKMGSNWSAPSHQMAASVGHQYPDYPDSQISPDLGDPVFTTPASGHGLGISQPQSVGSTFGVSIENKVDHAFSSTTYNNQPSSPAFGMSMENTGLTDPHDSFLNMDEFADGENLFVLHPSNSFNG